MPTITGLGFVDWSGRNIFSIEDQLEALEREREQAEDDLLDEAQFHRREPKSSMLLERSQQAIAEIRTPRLSLTITLKLDKEVPPQEIPLRYRGAFRDIAGQENFYTWESSEMQAWEDVRDPKHPLFGVILSLIIFTDNEVETWLCTHDMKTVTLQFKFKETIRHPSRFLQSLCNKLAKHGEPLR